MVLCKQITDTFEPRAGRYFYTDKCIYVCRRVQYHYFILLNLALMDYFI